MMKIIQIQAASVTTLANDKNPVESCRIGSRVLDPSANDESSAKSDREFWSSPANVESFNRIRPRVLGSSANDGPPTHPRD